MKKINEHFYEADEGCFIVRKEDDFIMGEAIDHSQRIPTRNSMNQQGLKSIKMKYNIK